MKQHEEFREILFYSENFIHFKKNSLTGNNSAEIASKLQSETFISIYLDDFGHFRHVDQSVVVDVVHFECPLEFLSRIRSRRHADCQQEFFEVDVSVEWMNGNEMVQKIVGNNVGHVTLSVSSTYPSWSASNVRKTCSQNLEADPPLKNIW